METVKIKGTKCSKCGAEIQPTDTFCSGCGSPVGVKTISRINPGITREPETGEIGVKSVQIYDPAPISVTDSEPANGARSNMGAEAPASPETGAEMPAPAPPPTDTDVPPVRPPKNDLPVSERPIVKEPAYDPDHPTDQSGSNGDQGSNINDTTEDPHTPDPPPGKKKKWPVILGVCVGILCLLGTLLITVWEPFSAEDARALVKAELDSEATGEYDESFEFGNMTRDEIRERREDKIRADVESMEISDSLYDRTYEMDDLACRKAKYSVGKAEENDDGSFSVRVTIEPLDLLAGIDDAWYENLAEQLSQEQPELMEEDADENALDEAVWDKMLDHILNVNLPNPSYRDPEYVTVKVSLREDAWYADEDDIEEATDLFIYVEEE